MSVSDATAPSTTLSATHRRVTALGSCGTYMGSVVSNVVGMSVMSIGVSFG